MINKIFGNQGIREQGGAFTKTPFFNSGYIANDMADSSKYVSTLTSGIINNKTVGQSSFFYSNPLVTHEQPITVFDTTVDGGYLTDVIIKNEPNWRDFKGDHGTEPCFVAINRDGLISDFSLLENESIRFKGKITKIIVRAETSTYYSWPIVFGIKNE